MTTRRVLAVVFLPWQTARFLLKPQVGPQPRDRLLDRLGFWRAAIGLAVVALTSLDYLTPGQIVDNVQDKTVLTELYALVGVPLALLVLFVATRSAYRRQLIPGTLRLLRRAGIGIACHYVPLGLFFAIIGYVKLISGIGDTDSGPRALLLLAGVLVMILFGLWCGVFWPCVIYWGARTSFWLSEAHPLFAPVGSVVLVLVVTGQETIAWDTKGVPSPLWLGLNICGLISTLVLASFEYRHLRSSGYRFRGGPNRGVGAVSQPDGKPDHISPT